LEENFNTYVAYINPCNGEEVVEFDQLPGGNFGLRDNKLVSGFFSGGLIPLNQEAFDKYKSNTCGCQFYTVGYLQYRAKIRVNSCSCYSESLLSVETLHVYKHTCDDGWVEITNEIYQTNRKITYSRKNTPSYCNPEPADFPDVPAPLALASSYPCLPMP
jgi:hypothetical protein